MLGSDAETILIRAINATRQGFFPAYAGLRISAAGAADSVKLTLELIQSRLRDGPVCRLRSYQQYKGTDPLTGQHDYRDCMAASPFTALTEAVVLSLLAGQEAFAPPSRAYSYHWPKTGRTGANFDFFATRYHQRNEDIANLLGPDDVATIVDIRRFYPSVDPQAILGKLEQRLAKSTLTSTLRQDVAGFAAALLKQGGGGLPIGPATSHYLGHLALEDVDQALSNQFQERYFRYVDDIVVVTPKSSAGSARDAIKHAVDAAGFRLNEDKDAELDVTGWRAALLSPDIEAGDSFKQLVNDVSLWLAYNDAALEPLLAQCRASGVSLPLTRIHALSRYTRFQRLSQSFRSPRHWLRTYYLTHNHFSVFLERAVKLKRIYETAFQQQLRAVTAADEKTKRWPLQRLRRIANPLFYLRAFGDWSADLGVLDGVPQLQEQAALARSLSQGTPVAALRISARSVAAFCDLWGDYGGGRCTLPENPLALGSSSEEGLCTLRLHDLLDAPSIQRCVDASSLFRAIGSDRLAQRHANDLSFEDELESLRLPYSADELAQLVRSRYSELEDTALAALRLSGSQSAS